MTEPGDQEVNQPEASPSGITVETTPAVEGEGGIRTGSIEFKGNYHVLTDGTVYVGPLSKAIELNQAAAEKGTRI